MIINSIDITTEEGKELFNEKYKGKLVVSHNDGGGVTLQGIGKDQVPISYDTETHLFEVED